MPPNRLVHDGLWRCLCPAVDQQMFWKAVRSPIVLQPLRQPTRSTNSAAKTGTIQQRRYGTSSVDAAAASPYVSPDHGSLHTQPEHTSWEVRLLAPTPPSEETLKKTSIDNITSALLMIRGRWRFHKQEIDRHTRIVQFVTHLVRARAQPLKPFIYECMMDAMVDPKGSTRGIRALFKDMASQGMKPTATMCHSALQALTIHPDYVLRHEVLATMQDLWFAVETSGQQSLVVGLLRDEQYELAYETLMKMIGGGVNIEPWVYDIFVLVLGKLGFVDEMLQVLHQRETVQALSRSEATRDFDALFPSLLYHALDVCSQNFHITGTVYAWDKLVKRLQVSPSDGIVENVLATAARHGESELAVDALDLLSQRSRFQAHHYEATAEAFCKGRNVAGALGILDVMAHNGVVILQKNTRMLYLMLKENPDLVEEAVAVLEKLQQERIVPPAAVASIVEAIAELRGSEATMDLCGNLQEMTGEEPNPTIFRHLICNSRTSELRQSLFETYKRSIAEKDDPTTTRKGFNQLIPLCIEAGEWDMAFQFASQATEVTSAAGLESHDIGWFGPLFNGAVAREDRRVWQIVDGLSKSADESTVQILQKMLQQSRWRRPDIPGISETQEANGSS